MIEQTQSAVTLELTMDEVNTVINIITQAPLPYNVSHPLIQKIGSQVVRQSATQSATHAGMHDTPDEPADEPTEHAH